MKRILPYSLPIGCHRPIGSRFVLGANTCMLPSKICFQSFEPHANHMQLRTERNVCMFTLVRLVAHLSLRSKYHQQQWEKSADHLVVLSLTLLLLFSFNGGCMNLLLVGNGKLSSSGFPRTPDLSKIEIKIAGKYEELIIALKQIRRENCPS